MELNLNTANAARFNLTQEQADEISKMYAKIADDIHRQKANLGDSATDYLRGIQLHDLEESIARELLEINNKLGIEIPETMRKVCDAVVADNQAFANQFNLEARLANVSTDVVNSLLTGQVYEGDWSLSKALWKDYQSKRDDINRVIAEGIAQNKSALEIAQDLEKYVDPNAAKPWDWNKVYPGTATKVDYNAQRLARTMVSHAYQQALVVSCKSNPFVTGFRWEASNSERTCPICHDRDGQIFSKEDLPLDHPNGMCTFEAVITDSFDEIADRLADWVLGEDDPELDEYARYLGYDF